MLHVCRGPCESSVLMRKSPAPKRASFFALRLAPPALSPLPCCCPLLRPGSRGITDDTVGALMGNRPNVKIMGATSPEALKKYSDADKVLCF
jgi:hypothetical protein